MSDWDNLTAPPSMPPDPGLQPVMQIVITLTSDNRIMVAGSIETKTAAYGLLEAAKDAIRLHIEQQAQRRVQIAGNIPGLRSDN